jgi:hypothetical protein
MELIDAFKLDIIDHFAKSDLRKQLVSKKEFDATLIEHFKNEFKQFIKDFSYKHDGYNIKDFGSLDELNLSRAPKPKTETHSKKDVHIVITDKKAMKKEKRKLKKKK